MKLVLDVGSKVGREGRSENRLEEERPRGN